MTLLSWNCRGLGSSGRVDALKDVIAIYKPKVVFLIETLVQRNRMEFVNRSLGFDNIFTVDSIGRSGGLCLLWSNDVSVSISYFSSNFIDANVRILNKNWRLTGYYGYPESNRRRESWNMLRMLSQRDNQPWLCFGDFNDLLSEEDKWGEVPVQRHLINGFSEAVTDCALTDLPWEGFRYTWEKKRNGEVVCREKLDRAMATADWADLFPNAISGPITAPISDHAPILIRLQEQASGPNYRKFRFDNCWLGNEQLGRVIEEGWQNHSDMDIINRRNACIKDIETWGRSFNKEFWRRKRYLQRRVEEAQENFDDVQVQHLKTEWNTVLFQEHSRNKQVSKQRWILDGDKNSKFFHASIKTRRKKSRISQLVKENGELISEEASMREVVADYFEKVYRGMSSNGDEILDRIRPKVTQGQNILLTAPVTLDEVRTATFDMHPDKSPGPDGLNPAFFQKYWHVLGVDVWKACLQWLDTGIFPNTLTDTHIVLLPKCENPKQLTEFRPISLCNVLYKIVAKTLANRLKSVLPMLIDECQSAFVPGRLITDNVAVAFELLHNINNRAATNGACAMKIDISKAYDRVDWRFLRGMLTRMGFCEKWVQWMMMCVIDVKYTVLFNGKEVGPITPGRGLRQGDPLSPYLFLFCTEGLSLLFQEARRNGELEGVKVCRDSPSVTHLLFADDSFFFFEGSIREAEVVANILNVYERASGQSVNFSKSGVFFSPKMEDDLKTNISRILGVTSSLEGGRYLGLPSLIGRSKSQVFNFLRDSLDKRIGSWSNRFLSRAGKEVLIKSVAQAVPTYCMSMFKLPLSVCDALQKRMNKFWWGVKAGGRRSIHWLAWERMCSSKDKGGMGFRDIHCFNLALLAKQGWRLMTEHNTLFYKIFKSKYFHDRDFLDATIGRRPSYIWRSIHASIKVLKQGVRWRVGSGASIGVLSHPWLPIDHNFYVSDSNDFIDNNLVVSDLWVNGERRWDVEKIMSLFSLREFKAILSIPISIHNNRDQVMWHWEKKGVYSVRSGYHVAWDLLRRGAYNIQGDIWSRLWKIDVSPKDKDFMWRAMRDVLPTKEKLRSRGVDVEGGCPWCGEVEDINHCLLLCCKAKGVWRQGGFVVEGTNNSFINFFMQLLHSGNNQRIKDFMVHARHIWLARNNMLWNDSREMCYTTHLKAKEYLRLWGHTQGLHKDSSSTIVTGRFRQPPFYPNRRSNSDNDDTSWHAFVDGSVFTNEGMLGFGAVMETQEGSFIRAISGHYTGGSNPLIAEALALRSFLSYIRNSNQSRDGTIFIDSQVLFFALSSLEPNRSEVGIIISDCKLLLLELSLVNCRWIRRQANRRAHKLARASIRYAHLRVWDSIPDCLCDSYHF